MKAYPLSRSQNRTGYNDYFYFTKVFKKNTGISPSKISQKFIRTLSGLFG